MNLNYIDWIWHVRGSVPLAAGQSSHEAFDRLDPLFRQTGTSHERTNDVLVFSKKDQAAQDKMSVFNSGILRIEKDEIGPVLRYDLISRALLFCFLAPLLFLGFAQLTIFIGKMEKASTEAASKTKGAAKKPEKKKVERPQNPVDKFLGAPAPEKPKKDGDKSKDENDKYSPTPAYVFAGIFAALYVIGRILEDWLIKRQFKSLLET